MQTPNYLWTAVRSVRSGTRSLSWGSGIPLRTRGRTGEAWSACTRGMGVPGLFLGFFCLKFKIFYFSVRKDLKDTSQSCQVFIYEFRFCFNVVGLFFASLLGLDWFFWIGGGAEHHGWWPIRAIAWGNEASLAVDLVHGAFCFVDTPSWTAIFGDGSLFYRGWCIEERFLFPCLNWGFLLDDIIPYVVLFRTCEINNVQKTLMRLSELVSTLNFDLKNVVRSTWSLVHSIILENSFTLWNFNLIQKLSCIFDINPCLPNAVHFVSNRS